MIMFSAEHKGDHLVIAITMQSQRKWNAIFQASEGLKEKMKIS